MTRSLEHSKKLISTIPSDKTRYDFLKGFMFYQSRKIKTCSQELSRLQTCLYFSRLVLFVGFFALVLPLSGFTGSYKKELDCPNSKQHYRTTLRHIESGGIGYKDGYTTLEVFFSPDSSQWKVTPFFDARGHIFNNGKWAFNTGIGLRALWNNRVYGINAYYDYRNLSHFNSNQIGVGLETLGKLFDFRVNSYLPVGAKISGPYDVVFKKFSGNYMLLSQKYESVMKGADAEFGFHFGKSSCLGFYASAGPYYFKGKIDRTTWGGKAKISGALKDILTLEISDSYDRTFRNKFQGQISLIYSFGPKSKVTEQRRSCKLANTLNDRMLQPVSRQEIIVVDNKRRNAAAIDPATGLPYFFVFVNNTSSSDGTYESPYHSLVQAQDNSSPNDIIYVFPGDGTTRGMDSGIFLKPNQKFWGSSIGYSIQTSQGMMFIPAQTSLSPSITNTNINTDGNAITLSTNNDISGFRITSAMNDAIYGSDPQNLQVSYCRIENTTTYAIEASFSSSASISLTNNQFLNNVNGVFLALNGTSSLNCSDNTFKGQTSISDIPLNISSASNILAARIENNVFDNNVTGSVRFSFHDVVSADISLLANKITNNGTGAQASLGSSFVIISDGISDQCSIVLANNTFSGNTSNSVYLHTSGVITNLEITASRNTMSDNGGSALVLATPVDDLMLLVTDNIISRVNDNAIAVISSGLTSNATIEINNNAIFNIGNTSNGIAVNQDFSTLNLTILNNEINRCEGTGFVSYAPTGIDSLIFNISGNTISNCQNMSSNAAAGLDIEQYTTLVGSVTNNTLSGNTGLDVVIGSTLPIPTACVILTGNESSADYLLINPFDGFFNLSPCNVDALNIGTINTSGVIAPVKSCPEAISCPP